MSEHSSASHGPPATFAAPPIGLRELLEAAPDVVFCCDAEGRWMWLNEAVAGVTGFKPRDLLGHRCTGIIAAHERRLLVRAYVKLVRGLESDQKPGETLVLLHVMTAAGGERAVAARVRARMADSGDLVFVGVARAVSEEELAAARRPGGEAAEGTEVVIRPVYDNAPEPGLVGGEAPDPTDRRRRTPHTHRQLAQDVLFEPAQPGLSDSVRSEGAPDSVPPPASKEDVQAAKEGAAAAGGDAPPPSSSEDLARMRVQLEELREDVEAERDAAAAKMELLATMSHEIRTPMNGVMGMTHLLLETELDRTQRDMVDVIRSSSRALLSLINDTLDFSKLDAGKLEIEDLDFDLRVTVDEVAALLRPLTREKGLELDCRVHHDVPSRLKGDPGRVRQVLINFGGNAIKFTEEGGITIRVERVSEQGQEITLRFTVSDTGIGIAESKLPGLFQSFAQGDPSIARRFGGTGLGLAVSRRLIELMGGEVGARSEPGKGSTFWFTLPLAVRREEQVAEVADEDGLKGLRVLVVDHSRPMREGIVEKLVGWGATVEPAESGAEALEKLRGAVSSGAPFQIALLDMQTPDMTGEELGAAIRADDSLSATRLAMLTSVGRRGDGARVQGAGFSAYLMKPVPWPELREAMFALKRRTEADDADEQLVTRHSLAEARRGRLRILLVEDNPVNQLVAQWALRRNGYGLDVVTCANEAFEAWEKQRYDLILMDIHMPDQNGYEATRELRRREEGRGYRTPIVAMTANDAGGERERCIEAGMDDYLAKPVDLSVLSEMVDRFTRQSLKARLASESGTTEEDGQPERGADRGPAPTTGNTGPEELRKMLESEAARAIGFEPSRRGRRESAGVVRKIGGVARIDTKEEVATPDDPSKPLVDGGNAYDPSGLGGDEAPSVKRIRAEVKEDEEAEEVAQGNLESGYGEWLHETGKGAQSPKQGRAKGDATDRRAPSRRKSKGSKGTNAEKPAAPAPEVPVEAAATESTAAVEQPPVAGSNVAAPVEAVNEAPAGAATSEVVEATPSEVAPSDVTPPEAGTQAPPETGTQAPPEPAAPAAENDGAPEEPKKQRFSAAVMKLFKREVHSDHDDRSGHAPEAGQATPPASEEAEAYEPHGVERQAAQPVEPDPTPRDPDEIEAFEPDPAREAVAEPVSADPEHRAAADADGFENIVIGADSLAPPGSESEAHTGGDPEGFEPFVLGAESLAPVGSGETGGVKPFAPAPDSHGGDDAGITRSVDDVMVFEEREIDMGPVGLKPEAKPAAPATAEAAAETPAGPPAEAEAPAPVEAEAAEPATAGAETPVASDAHETVEAADEAAAEPGPEAATVAPEAIDADASPIDRKRLDESSMGIPALREALLQAFLSDIEPRLDRLGQAIESGDARRVEFEAHGLKGMTATIGANACMAAFFGIETCGREQRLREAEPLLRKARAAVAAARRHIADEGLLEAA